MTRPKRLHKLLLFFFMTASLTGASIAHAFKAEFSVGGYSFSAENKVNNTSATLSGAGSYHVALFFPLKGPFLLDLGYSLLASDGVSGDLSFGVDLGAVYFPLTSPEALKSSTAQMTTVLHQRWRPFVGLAFHQRNFQSTSSQYAGAGVKLGTEYQLTDTLALTTALRYISMGGPNQSTATQTDILAGLSYQF